MTKHKNFIYILFMNMLLICSIMTGQSKKTTKAKTDFKSYAYAEAIEIYEQLIKEGYKSEEIYSNLGDSYYQKADYNAAAHWYGELFNLENISLDSEYMYRYAQTLKSLGDYESSDSWMNKFSVSNPNDIRVIKYKADTDYLENIKRNSSRYEIKNLPINSTASDFAPSFFGKELVFSTARDSGRISKNLHKWNNRPFSNLYSAKLLENGSYANAERLSKKLNKKTHETSTIFTKDGTTVYFTRNNSKNGNFARDKNGLSRLKVYRGTLRDGEWEDIMELPFNSDDYSVAHPTLSPDEKKLYFASDMPGTFGQSDIFVVDINADGTFGTPKNLGSDINTESRETFPHVTQENVLYFASDGHPGLGGLDIFATRINDMNNFYIVNVGEPVNSKQDDFSFIIDEESRKGFFASNRDGGIGSDDIYSFNEVEEIVLSCNPLIEGVVKDKDSREPLVGAEIILFSSTNEIIAKTISGEGGVFKLKSSCIDGEFKVVGTKNDFENGEEFFTIFNLEDKIGLEVVLAKVVEQPTVGTDLIKYLNLSPIYFDLDKSEIRPDAVASLNKVIEFIKEYPTIKIDVRSHTDASASDQYNIKLSERRAKATIAYLVANGIGEDRLSGQGFGETQLLNDCVTKAECNDDQHQINRRSEFIVVK